MMGDGKDYNLVAAHAVDNAIGKGLRDASANRTAANDARALRKVRDVPDNGLDRFEETDAQTIGLLLVELGCGNQFGFRLGMESDGLHTSAANAFRKTESASRRATSPASTSRSR